MIPGLRTHHSASLRVAVADGLPEDMRDATRELLDVRSTNPRKGHASALMWTVCTEADRERLTLIIQPRKFDDGMPDELLTKFYAKFGFVVIQNEPVTLMARAPELPRIARPMSAAGWARG